MGTGRSARLGAVLLSAAGVGGCAPDPPPCAPPEVTASAPLPRLGALWMLPMTVDGVTLPMALDTGAEFSILNGAALVALNGHRVRPLGALAIRGLDGPAATGAFAFDRVDLAGGELETADFLVEPGQPSMHGRFAGLIGNDLLSDWDVDIDGADDALQLERPQDCAAPAAPWRVGNRAEIVLSRNEDGEYVFPVRLDGRRVDAFFDTGAPVTSLGRDLVPLDPAILARDRKVEMMGIHGRWREGRLHRFSELFIAGRSFGPIDAVVLPAGGLAAVALGANLIAHTRIALLYRSRRAFIGDRQPRHPFTGPPVPPVVATGRVASR